MTRFAARRLLLVLFAKGIPYRLRRNAMGVYDIEYDTKWNREVLSALGA